MAKGNGVRGKAKCSAREKRDKPKIHALLFTCKPNVYSIQFNIIFMPQLVPFYFINQVLFAIILLTILIYVLSKYILPRFIRLYLTRIYIAKL
jgi:F-type H+-transporting ATPase subunit 8